MARCRDSQEGLVFFCTPYQQGSTGFDPTLAESINQDGLERNNSRRVDSNLRQSLGVVGTQKGLSLSLAPTSFPVDYPKITSP